MGKTSSEVKNRYNSKVYSPISVKLPKELVAQFRDACKANGDSQAQIIKEAIEQYLNTNGGDAS